MHRPELFSFLLPLLATSVYGAENLDCSNIRVDGQKFDLSKLKGAHSVLTTRFEPSTMEHYNTTYTLDVCGPLEKKGANKCPNGTRVCAVTHLLSNDTKGESDTVTKVVAVAGNLENAGGSRFEVTPTRLKTSDSNSDRQKEGLRLVLGGGKYPLKGSGAPPKEITDQKAIIEFLCDPDKEGTEGEWVWGEGSGKLKARDDEKKEGDDKEKEGDKDGDKGGEESTIEHQLKHDNATLIWDGYEKEKDVDVLRLTWHTKYACESQSEGGDGNSSSHWGFFTWFIIIAFLGIAGYLIFASWINFTRYGARGWDLLPHSDTIRDIPYLLKDWIRRVLNTVQGTGSRGGYSAV